jgi:mannose-1-phosphate guanylyltransferase
VADYGQSQPKQYLDIFDGKSLFDSRSKRKNIANKVMVVGIDNRHLSEKVLEKSKLLY